MVYVGGKKKLAKYICPILQKELDTGKYSAYVEPFGGGGNIMENINFPVRYFYDINKYLIAFYKALQDGWEMPQPNSFGAEHYNEVKSSFKAKDWKYPDYYYGYMMFVPSYNGKMWGSYAKDGRLPYQKEHYLSVKENFLKIKDCVFEAKSYENLAFNNCLIYCDIPYRESKKQYYDIAFDYKKFYDWARVNSKNNKIFISETTMPDDFKIIWEKEYMRTLGHQKNFSITEKLYTI